MCGKKLYLNCELSKVYQNSLINADINISGLLNGRTHRIEEKHNKLGEVRKNIRTRGNRMKQNVPRPCVFPPMNVRFST